MDLLVVHHPTDECEDSDDVDIQVNVVEARISLQILMHGLDALPDDHYIGLFEVVLVLLIGFLYVTGFMLPLVPGCILLLFR